MAHQQFLLSETNPNDSTGGGGCICDEEKQRDCKPPYVVCYQNGMESPISPHVVACASCIEKMYELVVDPDAEQAVVGNRGDSESVNPSSAQGYSDDVLVVRQHNAEQPPLMNSPDEDEKPDI